MLLRENIPVKYVFGKIRTEIILVTVYASSISLIYHFLHLKEMSIPVAVPTILGTIISLLLAFRSNQAYDRWWEARTLWGAIVNDCRSLSRQVLTFIDVPQEEGQERVLKERIVKRQIAWAYSVSRHLRTQDPLDGLNRFISAEDLQFLRKYNNVPNALAELQGQELREAYKSGYLNEYQQTEMDRTLTRFSNHQGGCERIKNTVFPATYSVYIHISVILFVLLLPFGLLEYLGMLSIPLVIGIACSFFLIEKMAIHLQDPFENRPTDTPTTSICQKIEIDLRQMLKESHEQDLHKFTDPGAASEKSKVYYIL